MFQKGRPAHIPLSIVSRSTDFGGGNSYMPKPHNKGLGRRVTIGPLYRKKSERVPHFHFLPFGQNPWFW